MSLRAISLSALILLCVTPARAGTLEIDFDVSSSVFVPFSSNVSVQNGMNGTAVGSAKVVLTDVDASGVPSGLSAGGTLSSFQLDIQLMLPLSLAGGAAMVLLTGPVSFQQMGSASGAFDGQTLSAQAGQLTARFTADVGCVSGACSAIQSSLFRAERLLVDDMIANALPLVFGFSGLQAVGMAALQASIADTVTTSVGVNMAIRLDLRGRETARRFVDEPSWLTEASLVALALLGALAARRPRAT